jgi:hypothetical protein
MPFKWDTHRDYCDKFGKLEQMPDISQEKVMLERIEFRDTRIGCCGSARNDSICPIIVPHNFPSFKKEAIKFINDYDGNNFSLEYFQGVPGDDFRGNGKSFFKISCHLEGLWEFYKDGEFVFLESKDFIIKQWGE